MCYFAIALPWVVQLELTWMSIEVPHWLGGFVLILAPLSEITCEIGRNVGEYILQIPAKDTSRK